MISLTESIFSMALVGFLSACAMWLFMIRKTGKNEDYALVEFHDLKYGKISIRFEKIEYAQEFSGYKSFMKFQPSSLNLVTSHVMGFE